jgi:DNA-binding CsgD family transcriptional regulator
VATAAVFRDNPHRREQRVVAQIGETTGELLERESSVARLSSALERARAGDGCVVLVEGEAGIGKTALLEVARARAHTAGCTVLNGRGGKLERDFAHGVARQLYEPLLNTAPVARRKALLSGAAHLAAPVLGLTTVTERADVGFSGDPGFAANHGLYWLTANLAESGPLLLIVDDAHWADSATLLFINYLGRRLEGLSVLVLLGFRLGEAGTPHELLESLLELPRAESVHPSALSEEASGVLIERMLGRIPHESFRRACHEVTGGNPFLLNELLRALLVEDVNPGERVAERVRRLGPRSISRSVLGRLGSMGPEALALAKAVSVLDTDAELRHAAALAELDRRQAEGAADALTAAQILAPGRPLRFVHPIIRQAIYEDLPDARRASDHARAAHLLDSKGGDPDRAAVHLLVAEPAADEWVVDQLRAAARRALARGAPDASASLLRRALAEPPSSKDWAPTLLELGRAERLAGDPAAVEHLRQAAEQSTDPVFRAEAARELATGLAVAARLEEAVELLEHAIEHAPDRETALLLEAHLFGLSQASDELAARVAPRLERACEGMLGDTPGERLALAANVFHRTFLGLGSGDDVASLARRAWGDGRLLREATGDHFAFYGPLIALRDSDHHDELRPMFDAALADARARGSAAAAALTLATLARLEQLQGNLVGAEAAGRSAVEAAASSTHYRLILPLALSAVILPLVERGEAREAEDILAAHELAAGPPPPTSTGNPLLAARAKLRLAQGRVHDAVRDTRMWLDHQRRRGGLNAVGASSILNPALPFLAAGDTETARDLADEMLAVAQRWGVPGYAGSCMVAVGLVRGGERGIEYLQGAVELLERSPRRLELALGLVELGAALRRANRRADSREPLRKGMEVAHRCGAVPLAERARAELRATGARPRRLVLTGVDSLTAQERRVAEMAAQRLSNPEIAQALFVTRRTVETHLRHAYQKLGIGSREELTQAFQRDSA